MHMFESIFRGCSSLEYINLENAIINIEEDSYEYIFYEVIENILICSNDYEWNEILNGLNVTIYCDHNIEYHCFKKNLNKPYYKYICKQCGEDYYQIYNYTNYNNSYIYCNTTKLEKKI